MLRSLGRPLCAVETWRGLGKGPVRTLGLVVQRVRDSKRFGGWDVMRGGFQGLGVSPGPQDFI